MLVFPHVINIATLYACVIRLSFNHVSEFVDHVYIVSRCLRQRSCWLVGKGYQERVFVVRMVRVRGEK